MRQFLLAIAFALPIAAQTAPTLNFVMPRGPGKITLNPGAGWQPESLALYDDGTRPTILLLNKSTGLDLSYILFPNNTGTPTAESCRDAVIDNLSEAVVKNKLRSARKLADGRTFAVASYLLANMGTTVLNQQNVYGFFGDKNTCAEIHLSKVHYVPADDKLFNEELDRFPYDGTYTPNSQDYGAMATIFFEHAHDTKSAAIYYRTALDNLTDAPISGYDSKIMRRILTDQLSMSYGMSGDLARSRAVNEAAILKDPDYPLYYYNLACADAESGDATAARTHLQQASDRRANTLKGEKFPDPTQDDSILKLKQNKVFWDFVQSLPKS